MALKSLINEDRDITYIKRTDHVSNKR